jgi:acetone carboxylase gamma subunit
MGICESCDKEIVPEPRVIDHEYGESSGTRVREWVCPECATILGVSESRWESGAPDGIS